LTGPDGREAAAHRRHAQPDAHGPGAAAGAGHDCGGQGQDGGDEGGKAGGPAQGAQGQVQDPDEQWQEQVQAAAAPLPSRLGGRWAQDAGQNDGKGVLGHAVEHEGGDDGVEDAPEGPAHGDAEVERGELAARGPILGQAAVAHEGGREEGSQVRRRHEQDRLGDAEDDEHHQLEDQEGLRLLDQGREDRRPGREDHDEAEQVQRQGDDPEQRHGGDVGGDVRGDRQHEAGRGEGQRHPTKPSGRPEAGMSGRVRRRG
jgi:hypothetical protein